jgi:thiol-disulfide isomerase/thioredoxin
MRNITIISILILLFTSPVMAIEVGDQAPNCIYTATIYPDGTQGQACVENFEDNKFLLLEFMSIYCRYCVTNLPIFNQLADELKDVMSAKTVSIDRQKSEVLDFWGDHQTDIKVPFAMDYNRNTKKPYGIRYTPTMVLLNAQNVIIFKHSGLLDEAVLQEIRDLVLGNN